MLRSILKTGIKTQLGVRNVSKERCINKVTLLGRVGSDAQLRGNEEHPVVIFKLATTTYETTEWHRVSVFKPGLREMCEAYVKSGSRLLVEGKITYGHIIDRNGTALPTTSIIADEIIFLASSSKTQNNSNATEEELTQEKLHQ